jgi:hypothetical protein
MIKLSSLPQLFYRIAPIFLVISLFVIYLFSIAPDITWAHDGADGGDLMTAAATGGVAHPSGYPTFLLLARLFQFLPVGTIAYRTNLMSAVFTTLTGLLVYDIVVSSPNSPVKDNRLAGLIAGYAYGLSPLAWSQAVITEVYPLHIFFVILILWLLVGRFAYSPNRLLHDAAIGLSMGLAMGNHLTSAALLPVALLVGIVPTLSAEPQGKKNSKRKKDAQTSIDWTSINWTSLGRRLGAVLVGLFVYAFILWRAGTRAPINWGYADNLNNLWWLVSGALYQHLAFSLPIDEVPLRVISVAQLLLTQFGVLGLLVGIYHLFGKFSLSRLSLITGWVALTNTIFSLGYDSTDSYLYLLPFFLVFAIWIGFGIGNITRLLARQKNWLSLGVSAILLASFWGMAMMNYPKIDLSGDHRTQKFEKAVFAALPPQAIVIAKGDRALFSLWYYHFVLIERQDIAVLSRGLLRNAWYIDILHDTYSTLNISLKDVASSSTTQVNSIPFGADTTETEAESEAVVSNSIAQVNPTRPVCNVTIINEQMSVIEQMSIVCYLPASQKPNTTSISILQPIDK